MEEQIMPDRVKILESRELIIEVFKSFREELMKHYGNVKFDVKADSSTVTEYDKKIEQTLREKLLKEYPEFGFKGEETGYETDKKCYWIVDPIDSTESFIRGLPNCTNMAAFMDGEEIIASVVYDFVADKMYTAYKGEGAWCDSERIKVSNSVLNLALNMWGSKHYTRVCQLLSGEMSVYKPIGAAGMAFTWVASGKFEGLLNMAVSKEHDIVPGMLLAAEAGAEIVRLKDNEHFGYFFMGNKAAVEVIKKHQEELIAML